MYEVNPKGIQQERPIATNKDKRKLNSRLHPKTPNRKPLKNPMWNCSPFFVRDERNDIIHCIVV